MNQDDYRKGYRDGFADGYAMRWKHYDFGTDKFPTMKSNDTETKKTCIRCEKEVGPGIRYHCADESCPTKFGFTK